MFAELQTEKVEDNPVPSQAVFKSGVEPLIGSDLRSLKTSEDVFTDSQNIAGKIPATVSGVLCNKIAATAIPLDMRTR